MNPASQDRNGIVSNLNWRRRLHEMLERVLTEQMKSQFFGEGELRWSTMDGVIQSGETTTTKKERA